MGLSRDFNVGLSNYLQRHTSLGRLLNNEGKLELPGLFLARDPGLFLARDPRSRPLVSE
jgi:hypothetical protein